MAEQRNTVREYVHAVYEGSHWASVDTHRNGVEFREGYRNTRFGIVLVSLATPARDSDDQRQWISFQAITDERTFWHTEHRTRSRFVSPRGAMALARKWIQAVEP